MKMKFYKIAVIISLVAALFAIDSGCSKEASVSKSNHSVETYTRAQENLSVEDAKKLLLDGNKRFVSGNVLNDDLSNTKREELISKGQHPFATVISCSDSRVPPEVIFDQALGDVFVVRNAGNVVDPLVLGSIEYGAEHLHTPIIVVLGHENCGAVKATVDGGEAPGSIGEIVDKINISLEKVKSAGISQDKLCEECENENIMNSIKEIRKSSVIGHLEEEKKVVVVGAKYDLNTGEVKFNPIE